MNKEGIKDISDFNRRLDLYLNSKGVLKDNYILKDFWAAPKPSGYVVIKERDFSGLSLKGLEFTGFVFEKCKFDDSPYLFDLTFRACVLSNCTFNNSHINEFKFLECELVNTTFKNTISTYMLFGDCLLNNTSFEKCFEILELSFGGCEFKSLNFEDVYLAHSRFEGHNRPEYDFKLTFKKSVLSKNCFLSFDLSNSEFDLCTINQNTFSNCKLANQTINKFNATTEKEFSFIDFQTILKSENIDPSVLKKCFGIDEEVIKKRISRITRKSEFQTVFISYSFRDKEFANRLNTSLKNKGISTFLWEKDAPGGRKLTQIMRDNIKNKDRLLFIASENSIKSKACQFELTQGRKKQEISWEDTLFPIHIDQYLFELEKEDIKPKANQSEYWSNISELKEINSVDFSKCNTTDSDLEFEKKVSEIIQGLEK